MTESRLLYFCKICCFMLLLSTSRFLFAAESVMVPSVSNEHFCLIDQIVRTIWLIAEIKRTSGRKRTQGTFPERYSGSGAFCDDDYAPG